MVITTERFSQAETNLKSVLSATDEQEKMAVYTAVAMCHYLENGVTHDIIRASSLADQLNEFAVVDRELLTDIIIRVGKFKMSTVTTPIPMLSITGKDDIFGFNLYFSKPYLDALDAKADVFTKAYNAIRNNIEF